MAELVLEPDRAIVDLGKGGRVIAAIVLGVFLLIGGSILAFMIRTWAAIDFDPAILGQVFEPDNDDGVFVLVFMVFGLAFTLIPLVILIGMFSGRKRPSQPRCFIFDNLSHAFYVWDQSWNPESFSMQQSSLPSYGYDQLEGLRIRSYTTSSSSSSGRSSSTTHYVVCLKKTDGGLWDLHDTTSQRLANEFLARLQSNLRFDPGSYGHSIANPVLPPRLLRLPVAGSTLFCWTNPSHFGGILAGMLFIAGFAAIMIKLASEALPFLIIGSVICGVITLILLKGIWDGIISLRYFHCLRLTTDRIQVGLVPRRLLAGALAADGSVDRSFVPDSPAIDQTFRTKKELDIRQVKRVQYSFRLNAQAGGGQELLLLDETAARDADSLVDGHLAMAALLNTATRLGDGILSVRLSGLSVAEIMAFERILESEITQRGGKAV